jgi:uncharacterized membrane protein
MHRFGLIGAAAPVSLRFAKDARVMNVSESATHLSIPRAGLRESLHPARRHSIQAKSAELWRRAPLRDIGPERVARGLGWFSIGLGLAELLAPRAAARLWGGSGRHTALIRLCGLREIASGLLIFGGGKRPTAGVWSRVAGDAIDLTTLSAAAVSGSTGKAGVAFAAANLLGVAAMDLLCAQELSRRQGTLTEDGALRVTRSIVINRPADEIYRFWRDLENLPRFMYHLRSVQNTAPRRSHWVAAGPGGTSVTWDAEITADHPDELLAWRSIEGSQVENAGTVRFEPRAAGRGTIVRVELEYRPPGGIAGAAAAALFHEAPQQQLHDDLKRLKQVLEIGEVVRSDGSPDGTGSVLQRPAQPVGERSAPFGRGLHVQGTEAR